MAQQYARDEAGNTWDVSDPNNPVFVSAGGADAGVVAPNPVQAQRQQVETGNAVLSGQRTAQQIALDAARAPSEVQKSALDVEATRLANEKARRELTAPPAPQQERQDRLTKLRQLANQIGRTQSLYNTGIGTTKGIAGLQDYLPTDANARLDVAGAQLSQQGLAAFRTPGTGTVSDRDAMMFDRGNLPTASTRDAAVEEQLRSIRNRVNEEMKALGQPEVNWQALTEQQSDTPRRDDNAPTIASGGGGSSNPPPPAGPAGYDVAGVAGGVSGGPGGGDSTFANAAGVAMATKLKDAYNRGAGVQELNSLLTQNGFQPFADPQAIEAISKRGPLNFAPPQVDDTRGGVGQAIGNMVDNPLGAYAANATDALTGNNLDSIAGGQTGLALDYANQQNPNASMAGTLVGSTAAAAGAELGLGAAAARAGIGASPWIARGADALYGAVSGAGQADGPNDSRVTEALLGGAGGLGGGIAGRAAARGIGGALRGVQNADVQGLRAAGVPLTAGQATGGILKGVEDRLSGLPVVGDVVNARRLEGMQGFNRAAFDEALAPVRASTGGTVGEQGVDLAQGQVSDAYKRALNGVSVQADEPFTQQMLGTFQKARSLPDPMAARAEYTLNTRVGNSFSDGSPLQRVGENDGWTQYNYTTPGGDIPLEVMQRRQGLEISIDENNLGGANRLGPRQLSEAASYLRSEYPDARYIYGMRTTGANPGRDQAVDLDRFPIAEPRPGVLSGEGFQQSIRGLQQDAAAVRSEPYGNDFGQVASEARGALEGMLERQAPNVLLQYNAASQAYRRTEILRDAVNRARNGTGSGQTGTFTPAQLSTAAAGNSRKFGNSQGTTRQPFFDLSRAGQAVLPNSVPDSGTAGRAVVAGGLGLAGLGGSAGYAAGDAQTGAGAGIGLAALLAAGGSKTGQRLITKALIDRPDALVQLGDQIQRRARIGGLFGAPMLAGAGGYFAGQ